MGVSEEIAEAIRASVYWQRDYGGQKSLRKYPY
jgi:hypothetical protein